MNDAVIAEMPAATRSREPLTIRMHERDNVAIVANDGGLPPGAVLSSGLTLRDRVPQGHKVALVDLAADAPVLRYGIPIGYALKDIPAGSWVHERLLRMPAARELDNLPIATVKPQPQTPLEGYTFDGYRNPDGSVGTRNILAITTTVQCVAGVVDFAVQRIKAELLPQFPNVDDVIGLEHTYGCGVAIDAPGAEIPIRTLAQHQPESELRRRGDGGKPRLRKTAARAADAAGNDRDHRRAQRRRCRRQCGPGSRCCLPAG